MKELIETYRLNDWMAYFYIYSFIGWCVETFIVSVSAKKMKNRGLLYGPVLPIYGFGAIIILALTFPVTNKPLLVYIIGAIAATILEYITALFFNAVFKLKFWDYSKKRANLQGYICLKSSLFWGALSVLIVCFIHNTVRYIVSMANQVIVTATVIICSIAVLIDLIFCIKNFSSKYSFNTSHK